MHVGIHSGGFLSERNLTKNKSLEKPKPETGRCALNAGCALRAKLELYGKQTSIPFVFPLHKPVGMCPRPARLLHLTTRQPTGPSGEVPRDVLSLYLKPNSQKYF